MRKGKHDKKGARWLNVRSFRGGEGKVYLIPGQEDDIDTARQVARSKKLFVKNIPSLRLSRDIAARDNIRRLNKSEKNRNAGKQNGWLTS